MSALMTGMPPSWGDKEWEAFLSLRQRPDGASSNLLEAAIKLTRTVREMENKLKKGKLPTDAELKKLTFRRKDVEIQIGMRST